MIKFKKYSSVDPLIALTRILIAIGIVIILLIGVSSILPLRILIVIGIIRLSVASVIPHYDSPLFLYYCDTIINYTILNNDLL